MTRRNAQGLGRPVRRTSAAASGAVDRHRERHHADLRQQRRHGGDRRHLRRDDQQRRRPRCRSSATFRSLGYLFKTTGRNSEKTELLIFLTPRVVKESLNHRAVRVRDDSRAWRLASRPLAAIHYNAPVHLHRGNLFLVGLPGAGKSTLGRQLARRLGKTFVDADAELEQQARRHASRRFSRSKARRAFAIARKRSLADLVLRTGIVLATGGGVVIRPAEPRAPASRTAPSSTCTPTPATLRERTRKSRHRPLLNAADPLARLVSSIA